MAASILPVLRRQLTKVRRRSWNTLRALGSLPCGRWRLWAELEKRDEALQLRMAQLLHELHYLADLANAEAKASNHGHAPAGLLHQREKPENAAALRVSRPRKMADEVYLPPDVAAITPDGARAAIAAIHDHMPLHADSFEMVLEASAAVLGTECTVLDLRARHRVHVVGDLHGSLFSIQEVLRLTGFPSTDNALIFNGDFVDRGKDSAEVLATLLLLKLAHPQDVFLLRGNHEDGFLATVYGFQGELRGKYPSTVDRLWPAILDVFSALPLCAVTAEAFVVHGGLYAQALSIEQLRRITPEQRKLPSVLKRLNGQNAFERHIPKDAAVAATLQGLLWADPSQKEDGITKNQKRGSDCVHFGADVARGFLKREGLKYLVRSHEVKFEGWESFSCGDDCHVFTVFSAADYPADMGANSGAVLRLCPGEQPEPIVFVGQGENTVLRFDEGLDSSHQSLIELVVEHKNRLRQVFERFDHAGSGRVTVREWAQVMQSVLELDFDWEALQPELVDTVLEHSSEGDARADDAGFVDFNRFLEQYAKMHRQGCTDGSEDLSGVFQALYRNHQQLEAVFRFLDTDASGALSKEEFTAGVAMLNDKVSLNERVTNIDELFEAVDLDGNGQIEVDEFCEVFKTIGKIGSSA